MIEEWTIAPEELTKMWMGAFKQMKIRRTLLLFFIMQMLVFAPMSYTNAEPTNSVPDQTRCTVCGMFVAKYPNWLAQIHYANFITDMLKIKTV